MLSLKRAWPFVAAQVQTSTSLPKPPEADLLGLRKELEHRAIALRDGRFQMTDAERTAAWDEIMRLARTTR